MKKVAGSHKFDAGIKDRVTALAKKEHRSYNNMLEEVVRAGLKAKEGGK